MTPTAIEISLVVGTGSVMLKSPNIIIDSSLFSSVLIWLR
jgi:hypothetical protein